MNKELKALEKIKKYLTRYNDTDDIRGIDYENEINVIETALKNYDELTSKPVILCRRTHGETQKLIDIICKNYKDVKITNLEDEKKVKAFEIIKEKGVNVGVFLNRIKKDIDYKEYKRLCGLYKIMTFSEKDLVKEEYELLKEVLL